jgi:hypothetical protein
MCISKKSCKLPLRNQGVDRKMKLNIGSAICYLYAANEALHPNDPRKIDFWDIMHELLVVDKQATMAFIPTITEPQLLLLLTHELYYVIDKFKCRKLAAIWKRQIETFKLHSEFERLMESYKEGITAMDWDFNYRYVRMRNRALWTFLHEIECNPPAFALYREIVGEVLAICKRATADIIQQIQHDFYMKEITIHIVYVTKRLKNIQLLKIWKNQIDAFKNSPYYWEMISYYQLAQQALSKYYIVEKDFKRQIRPHILLSSDMFEAMLPVDRLFDSYCKILMRYKIEISDPLHLETATAIQMRFLNHFKWLEPLRGDAWHCGLTYVCCWESGKPIQNFVETASFLLDEQKDYAIIWLSFRVNVFVVETFEDIILSGEFLPVEIGQHNRQRFNNSLESIAGDSFFKLESIRANTFEGQLNENGFIE